MLQLNHRLHIGGCQVQGRCISVTPSFPRRLYLFLNCRLLHGGVYLRFSSGESPWREGSWLQSERLCASEGKLIGGGDDEWELKGQMPETWHTDLSPPPFHMDCPRKTFLRRAGTPLTIYTK